MSRRMRISTEGLPYCGQQTIKRLTANGKNQKWLASQSQASASTISLIIQGKAQPSLPRACRICKTLNCGLDDVFCDVD